jgi:dolichol-phosphate mannosyltransferase
MNPTLNYELSIIIPVYNEQESFPILAAALQTYIEKASVRACVIFVNDASTDQSLVLIRDFCMRQKDFYYLSLERRNGVSGALKAALMKIKSPFIGYMDADLQTFPDDFEKLLKYRFDAGLVCGVRDFSHESLHVRFVKYFFANIRHMFTGDFIEDTGCPLKIGKTQLLQSLPWYSGIQFLLPALVQLTGNRVRAVNVRYQRRRFGKSKRNHVAMFMSNCCNLLVFMWMKKRYLDPAVRENNIDN